MSIMEPWNTQHKPVLSVVCVWESTAWCMSHTIQFVNRAIKRAHKCQTECNVIKNSILYFAHSSVCLYMICILFWSGISSFLEAFYLIYYDLLDMKPGSNCFLANYRVSSQPAFRFFPNLVILCPVPLWFSKTYFYAESYLHSGLFVRLF